MKKILFLFALSAPILQIACGQNPELWGITQSGVPWGGTIFKIKGDGTAFQTVCSMDSTYGALPFSLFQASDGKLYGTTYGNFPNGFGVLFSYDVASNILSLRHQFDTTARNPSGRLIETATHKIYGMTERGGMYNSGTIFYFDPSNNNYLNIYNFDGVTGSSPYISGLSSYSNGNFFSTTTLGGLNFTGVLFSFDTTGNIYSKLFDFDAGSGAGPVGTLTLAGNGLYYGMTEFGSNIFSFDPITNVFTNVLNLGGLNGQSPTSGLLNGNDGLLYGMTPLGGVNDSGIIFTYDPTNGLFTKRHDFGGSNGTYPLGGLMQASNGKLYGMTCYGGNYNLGVIFCYDPMSTSYNKIFDFNGINGQVPVSGDLIELDSSLLNIEQKNNRELFITISPNPTTGKLTISNNVFAINAITVFNLLGKKSGSWQFANGETEIQIDIGGLSPGIYFIQATSKEKTWHGNFIKE